MKLPKYPLSQYMNHEDIKSKTGKSVKDVTVENILSGNITSEDIKISKETLLMQGEIAEGSGRIQMKENFVRASELVDIPDDIVLKMYNALRPNRSTKKELLDIADALVQKYNAYECSRLVLEACDIYEKRGILIG